METIRFNELPKRCQNEINRFYSVDRFPTTIYARKENRKWEIRFIQSTEDALFRRQVMNISEWFKVIEIY